MEHMQVAKMKILDESLFCGNRLSPKHQGKNEVLMRKFKHCN